MFSLILGAAAVGFLIRELNRPQVAARVDQAMAAVTEVQAAPGVEASVRAKSPEPADPAQFRQLMELAGWDAARWQTFAGEEPLYEEQRNELAELIWRLTTFDGPQLRAWARATSSKKAEVALLAKHPGDLTLLTGRVIGVKRYELPAELANRLELPALYECQLSFGNGSRHVMILTARVPTAWLELPELNEPASVTAIFVKSLPKTNGTPHDLFVSRDVAWHPVERRPPFVSLGKSVLGDLGVDVGLLDAVRQRQPLSSRETEAFYQVLDAAGRIGANQLSRFARRNLPSIAQQWQQVEDQLNQTLATDPTKATQANRMRLQLAREVQSRTADGRFSVAPLFNEPERQVGELVELEGTVRRATRIDVAQSADGNENTLARHFGIDHYYELDLFTDDSQNNPVVFCVHELPTGFPLGDGLHEAVRIAGFFLKSWSFESRRATLPTTPDAAPTPANMRQFAPLLIGRAPIMLEIAQPDSTAYASYFAAALFLLLLFAVWAAGWWFACDERRLQARTLASRFTLPEVESLNDLDLDLSPAPPKNE